MNRTGRSWLMVQSQMPVVCAVAKVLSGSFAFAVKVRVRSRCQVVLPDRW